MANLCKYFLVKHNYRKLLPCCRSWNIEGVKQFNFITIKERMEKEENKIIPNKYQSLKLEQGFPIFLNPCVPLELSGAMVSHPQIAAVQVEPNITVASSLCTKIAGG